MLKKIIKPEKEMIDGLHVHVQKCCHDFKKLNGGSFISQISTTYCTHIHAFSIVKLLINIIFKLSSVMLCWFLSCIFRFYIDIMC